MSTFSLLDIRYLKPADILVSTTNALVSTIIRTGTHSVVSHAMLYLGEGKVIEAVGEGVKISELQNNINSHGYKNVTAFRYPSLSSEKAAIVVAYALKKNGKKYDYRGLIGGAENSDPLYVRSNPIALATNPMTMISFGEQMIVRHFAQKGTFNDPDKYFCSELVFEAYERSNVRLISDPAYMSYPQQVIDLGNRGILNYLGNLN